MLLLLLVPPLERCSPVRAALVVGSRPLVRAVSKFIELTDKLFQRLPQHIIHGKLELGVCAL